jgi:hypothetical protein
MVTTSNEFETIPAWEHISGCSLGTWSDYDTAKALVDAAVSVCSNSDVIELQEDFEKIAENDTTGVLLEFQDDAAEFINTHGTMEDYCGLNVEDGEWMVRPYIDDELPRFDDYRWGLYKDDYQGDHVLIVNDHGNVTCQRWNGKAYVTIWDMV